MITILKGTSVEVHWRIIRTENKITEDFTGAELRAFLVGPDNVYPLECGIEKVDGYNEIRFAVDSKGLSTGVYDLKAVWVKNKHSIPDVVNNQFMSVSRRGGVLAVTNDPSEVTPLPLDKTIKLMSYVESYGRDGMSAYELAAFRGVLPEGMSEAEWANQENVRQQNEEQRKAAEDARREAEDKREANERLRERGEAGRVSAEAAREAAEGVREATFQTNEAAREAEFDEAIQAAKDNLVVVQATGDSVNKVMSQKAISNTFAPISAIEKSIVRRNLINKNDADYVKGYYLEDGAPTGVNANYAITGYIAISAATPEITLSIDGARATVAFIAYYDNNKNFIKQEILNSLYVIRWVVGACYVRISYANYNKNWQAEYGTEITDYLPYDTQELLSNIVVNAINIPNNSVKGNDKLIDYSIDIEKSTFVRHNLFNPNDPDYLPGRFFSSVNGDTSESANYAVSGYIPFKSGKLILSVNGVQATNNGSYNIYYDKDKNAIKAERNVDTLQIATWFEGVAFVRFGISKYKNGNIQIERGETITEYHPYSQNPYIKEEYYEGRMLTEGSIGVEDFSDIFEASSSPNLLNKNTLVKGMYTYIVSSEPRVIVSANEQLMTSGFIKVKPLTTYSMSQGHSYIPFDADKQPLIDKDLISAGSYATFTTPENCEYIILNLRPYRDDYAPYNFYETSRLYESDTVLPYTPYGVRMGGNFMVKNQAQTTSLLGSDATTVMSESLSDGESLSTFKTIFPHAIKRNQISFSAKISNWDGGIRIGRGDGVYNSCYFTITQNEIKLYKWESSEYITLIDSVTFDLPIEEYINVVISERTDKALLVIQTLQGNFSHEFKYQDFNGAATVISLGATLTDCKLNISNQSLKCPVWMFGDSYYGSAGKSRQLYWLKTWGMLNCLVQGYGGQGSKTAFEDLERCMIHGTPKYIVWSLGMNDDNKLDSDDITTGNWYKYFTQVKQLCELNDITLIATTIPEVRGNYPHKDKMSEVIRNSGVRYIDVAKAVGSNAQGEWYGNGTEYDYQSTDNVHPSQYGASAIATQFLIDFPELMQY